MTFIKNKENFTCENCGKEIIGDGYTNHCPDCLWSKHVDVNPGDRSSNCLGLMEPIAYERVGDEISLVHQCKLCGHKKKNKSSETDNFDTLLKIKL